MIDITPAEKFVILTIVQQPTLSGLEVPSSTKEKPQIGTVYKIGKGKLPLPLKIGDTVIFKKYMGDRKFIPQLGKEFDFIPFDDIVAVLTETKTEEK